VQIEDGQKTICPFSDFADFPYYSSFTKIGLSPKESNCISQMWAWVTSKHFFIHRLTLQLQLTPLLAIAQCPGSYN
jgi:hypothetical protein